MRSRSGCSCRLWKPWTCGCLGLLPWSNKNLKPKCLTIKLSILNKFDHLAGFNSYLHFLKVIKTSSLSKKIITNSF
jgi:hypothetical protein